MTKGDDMDIHELAQGVLDHMERRTRTNGADFVCLKDGSPQWMIDLCHAVHDDIEVLPNDYIYEYIEDALSLIAWVAEDDDLDELICAMDGDTYTSDLLAWLESNLQFCEWVDEALSKHAAQTLSQALRIGNALHRQHVARCVLSSLKARVV